MPFTEEARECTVRAYTEIAEIIIIPLHQIITMSHKCTAPHVVAYESLKTKETPVGNSQKWSRSALTGAVAYESF